MKISILPFLFLLLALSASCLHSQENSLAQQINSTIEKGVHYLKSLQKPDGSFPQFGDPKYLGLQALEHKHPLGLTALCLLALLHSGVSPDEPEIKRGFDFLNRQSFQYVYDVSVLILALEARHLPPKTLDKPQIVEYLNEKIPTKFLRKLGDADRAWMEKAVQWLLKAENIKGGWEYSPEENFDPDYSNTQYALLALKAASRCEIKIPLEVWNRSLSFVLKGQEKKGPKVQLAPLYPEQIKDLKKIVKKEKEKTLEKLLQLEARGWGYSPTKPKPQSVQAGVYGSMTSAGIACLALCKSELLLAKKINKKLLDTINQGIESGFAWLYHHWNVTENPKGKGFYDYYYLYGLERAAVFYGVESIGNKDWYQEGATFICNNPARPIDYTFSDDVSFALLFLNRASIAVSTRSSD
jgi:hypothetical protein